MNKDLDLVIYGATGFTGQLCVEYLGSLNTDIRWAIAGRNQTKLEHVLKNLSLKAEIIIADSDDDDALDRLTQRTKVVLSTAGPFHRYGSKLVAACVKNSSHYVDITGENFWVRDLIDRHHDDASRRGVRIIPSCGYDSIPSDMGVYFCHQNLNEPIKRIESFHSAKGGLSGGTLETMFALVDLKLDKRMFTSFLLNPEGTYTEQQKKLSRSKPGVKKIGKLNGWSAPFVMAAANTRVVRRSAGLFQLQGMTYGNDFVYREFAFFKRKSSAYLMFITLAVFKLILSSPLRKLFRAFLKKPGQGPSKELQESGWFDCRFIAETESGETKAFRVKGRGDPGYKVTSLFVVEASLCLIKDYDQLPGGEKFGGVLTSATGLGDVLIQRLRKAGIIFIQEMNSNE
jgi:short subunit dehydrogenase-like uncharacterized protein